LQRSGTKGAVSGRSIGWTTVELGLTEMEDNHLGNRIKNTEGLKSFSLLGSRMIVGLRRVLIMDHNDPWDRWMAQLGKHMFEHSAKSRWRRKGWEPGKFALDEVKCFHQGRAWIAGRMYPDGFGAWDPNMTGATRVTVQPETLVDPETMKSLVPKGSRFLVEFAAVGQVDGPGTERCAYVARIWDETTDSEISGSRFAADKLSWAISAAIVKLPSQAKQS
jgi:hypothetical protein